MFLNLDLEGALGPNSNLNSSLMKLHNNSQIKLPGEPIRGGHMARRDNIINGKGSCLIIGVGTQSDEVEM